MRRPRPDRPAPLARLARLAAALTVTALPSAAQRGVAPETSAGGLPPSALVPSAASAGMQVEVLISEIAGAASNDVPGLPGVHFGVPPLAGQDLDVEISPSGRWVARWGTDQPFLPLAGHYPHVLLVDGQALLLEGDPAPLGPGNADSLSTTLGIDDDGAVLVGIEDALSGEQRIVRHDDGVWSLVASSSTSVPGSPGDDWTGTSFRGVQLTVDGVPAYYGALAGGLFQQAVVRDGELLLRTGSSVPGGQAGGASDPFWILDDATAGTSVFASAPAGDMWAARVLLGDLFGSRSALVVDGQVRIEEGQPPVAGHPATVSVFDDLDVDASGRWIASGHGIKPDTQAMTWVVGNGQLLAQSGGAVIPGSTERWKHAGFNQTGCALNAVGDWLLCGSTDAAAPFDEILVLNGDTILCREADPVDLDGNGQFDDDVFLAGFLPRGLALSEDGTVLCLVRLQDGSGGDLGKALLRLELGELGARGPWTDLGFDLAGTHGAPRLDLAGPLLPKLPVFFLLDDALENSVAWLVLALGSIQAPFKGGTLIPDPAVGFGWPLPTGPEGGFDVPVPWPDAAGGFQVFMQMWIADPGGPFGYSATTAWRGDVP